MFASNLASAIKRDTYVTYAHVSAGVNIHPWGEYTPRASRITPYWEYAGLVPSLYPAARVNTHPGGEELANLSRLVRERRLREDVS